MQDAKLTRETHHRAQINVTLVYGVYSACGRSWVPTIKERPIGGRKITHFSCPKKKYSDVCLKNKSDTGG